jgi:zinc finger protein
MKLSEESRAFMTTRTHQLLGQPCPNCREDSLTLAEYVENVDYFGPVLLTTISCALCGYRDTDVFSVTAGEPSVIRARIESPKDLTMKVVRSNSATIRVSKLGISIHPGISAQGFITDVEGVLDRMQQILEAMIPHVSQKRRERAKMILANLKKARRGKFSFVLELKDPSGRSTVAGSDMAKIKKRSLTKKELEELGHVQ